MKIPRFLLLSLLVSAVASAQTNTFPASGNVGIGTAGPGAKLEIVGDSSSNPFVVSTAGSPTSHVIIKREGAGIINWGNYPGAYTSALQIQNNDNSRFIWLSPLAEASGVNARIRAAATGLDVYTGNALGDIGNLGFSQSPDGNVGIGTASPNEKLEVAGDISVLTEGYTFDVLKSVAVPNWSFASRPAGWYRIATNNGTRANATFELKENADHSSVTFVVGSSYNSLSGASITVIDHSFFGSATFTKIRLITKGVYDPQYLDVYVDPHNNDGRAFWAFLKDNLRNDGWTLINYEAASVPSGYGSTEYSVDDLFVVAGQGDAESFRVNRAGNVGIGTTNPTQKLSVNGTVRAKEVIVDSGWSDFVFDKSYKLKALSETEAFIKAEKHLPNIPSAQEVAEHGVSVGEMQAKLLAKIEELTLHVIEQNKRQIAQGKELVAVKEELRVLRKQNP
jgi:hypothetical protein